MVNKHIKSLTDPTGFYIFLLQVVDSSRSLGETMQPSELDRRNGVKQLEVDASTSPAKPSKTQQPTKPRKTQARLISPGHTTE